MTSPSFKSRVRGFSLIEILIVITIIGLLVGLAVPAMQGVQERGRVTACMSNLKNLAESLIVFKGRNNSNWPKESGIRFLLALVRADAIGKKDMGVFICPGTGDDNNDGEAYKDWDGLDSRTISYAGRDTKNFPINKSREDEEVIASDDNEGRDNHRTQTCYVYADGVPKAFDRKIDKRVIEGTITFDEGEFVTVGTTSKVEELKKLQID